MAAINKATKEFNQLNTQKQAHCDAETWQNKKKKKEKTKRGKNQSLSA